MGTYKYGERFHTQSVLLQVAEHVEQCTYRWKYGTAGHFVQPVAGDHTGSYSKSNWPLSRQ
jgi:hypothetical protein